MPPRSGALHGEPLPMFLAIDTIAAALDQPSK
jgi:hypothetical protein